MERLIVKAILKMCTKAIVLTTIIGIAIGLIGYINKWNSWIAYSDAFFLAGCLAIVAGGMSHFAAGEEWNNFQLLSAESFRGMSSGERADFIISASSSISTLTLGVLSGILLILISALAAIIS